jgi:hypothetical protein
MNEIIDFAYSLCQEEVEAGATAAEIAAHVCDGLIARFGDGNPVTELGLRYIGLWIAHADAAHCGIDIDFVEHQGPMDHLLEAALREYIDGGEGMSEPAREPWLELAEQVHKTSSSLGSLGAAIGDMAATLDHIRILLEVERQAPA